MSASNRAAWIWMPHPAHLIVASNCRFHLATFVPVQLPPDVVIGGMPTPFHGFIVSTVGEWVPDAPIREIFARCQGVELHGQGDAREADYLKRVGFQEIGWGRRYETMVFFALPRPSEEGGDCCPWQLSSFGELDMQGYQEARAAAAGHLQLCEKWADCAGNLLGNVIDGRES